MGMGSHGHDQGSSWQMVKMMVIEELLKGQDSTTRLQALLQFEETPLLENSSGGNPMMELVVEVIETLSRAISLLGKETTAEAPLAQASSDEQKSEISGMKRKTQTPRRSGYRRRSHPYICRTVIAKEIEDGYTWRKYGQKIIYGTTHQRSYYRCSHKFDRDCQATRQVQKTEDASMFNIIYMGEHTCMAATELAAPCIISFKSGDTANTHQEAPLSSVPILPPIKLECDEEVLSNHSPRSGSTELVVLPDFSDFEGSAPVAHFMGIASDQYDVTSNIRYSTSTLDMEFDPEEFKLDDMLDFSEVQYIN